MYTCILVECWTHMWGGGGGEREREKYLWEKPPIASTWWPLQLQAVNQQTQQKMHVIYMYMYCTYTYSIHVHVCSTGCCSHSVVSHTSSTAINTTTGIRKNVYMYTYSTCMPCIAVPNCTYVYTCTCIFMYMYIIVHMYTTI